MPHSPYLSSKLALLWVLLTFGTAVNAAIDFENHVWNAFGGAALGCDGEVAGIQALASGEVLVYGEFRACGGTILNNVGAWNGTSWRAMGSAPNIGTNGRVSSAYVQGADTFLVGDFTSAGGVALTRWFAKLRNSAFSSLGADPITWPIIGGGLMQVELLGTAWVSNNLYAFGNFGVYRFESGFWQYADVFGGSGTDSGPQRFEYSDSEIMLQHDGGGLKRGIANSWYSPEYPCELANVFPFFAYQNEFYAYTAAKPPELVRVDRLSANGPDRCTVVSEPAPLAGLDFSKLVNLSADQDGDWAFGRAGVCTTLPVATQVCRKQNGSNAWVAVPLVLPEDQMLQILRIIRLETNRWVFQSSGDLIGNLPFDEIFEFSIANGLSTLGDPKAKGILGRVNAIALSSDQRLLFVGGSFKRAGRIVANNIAAWDGKNWNAIGVSNENGVNGEVFSIQPTVNGLTVGGIFTQAGSVNAENVARFANPVAGGAAGGWQAYGSGFFYNVRAVHQTSLGMCAGLDLSDIGTNPPISALQCWNPSNNTWQNPALGTIGGSVNTVSEFVGQIYAGGSLLRLNGVEVGNMLSRIVQEPPAAPIWQPVGTGANAAVLNLYRGQSGLFASGEFTSFNSAAIPYIAQRGISSVTWGSALPSPEALNGPVNAAADSLNALCFAGQFTQLTNLQRPYIVCRDGTAWRTPGLISTDAAITTMVITPNTSTSPLRGKVFVGGDFDFAGGKLSLGIAEFGALPDFADGFEGL